MSMSNLEAEGLGSVKYLVAWMLKKQSDNSLHYVDLIEVYVDLIWTKYILLFGF